MTSTSTTPDPPASSTSEGLLDSDERVATVDLESIHSPAPGPAIAPGTFRRMTQGVITLGFLIFATYFIPLLHFARPWVPGEDPPLFWNLIGREILGEGPSLEDRADETQKVARLIETLGDPQHARPPLDDQKVVNLDQQEGSVPPYQPHPDDTLEVPRSLELPTPTALDSFYEHLARTEARYSGAITRVSHWGDSVVANDNISSTLRFAMQRRFGDAGHGFHLLSKPNANYRHRGIRFSEGEQWTICYIINRCRKDGLYGFGGTIVTSPGGAESRFQTEDKLAFGQKFARIELWYRADPRGGRIRIKVDAAEPTTLSTYAPQAADAWHSVELSDDAHDIRIQATAGVVRLYGIVFERNVPGVVWDGMEQLGAFSDRMLNFDPEHLRQQVDHRSPNLLMFSFGGNDLTLAEGKLARYEQNFGEVLRRFRSGDVAAACVVMAPVDHGQRQGQRIISRPMVAKIVEIQRKVAFAEGCAFFDTVAAMGGEGSAARWRRATPPLLSGDLAHLTMAGQKAMGQMIYLALIEGYVNYRARTAPNGSRSGE